MSVIILWQFTVVKNYNKKKGGTGEWRCLDVPQSQHEGGLGGGGRGHFIIISRDPDRLKPRLNLCVCVVVIFCFDLLFF